MKIQNFWNADKFLSIAAFLISIGSFITFIYQTQLIQKQQYASALPYVRIGYSFPDSDRYTLYLSNRGIGPAFIEEIRVVYQGKIYNTDPANFIFQVVPARDSVRFAFANIGKGSVITANEQISLIWLNQSVKDAQKLKNLFTRDKAQIEIIYKSVYDETWQVKGLGGIPEKLSD